MPSDHELLTIKEIGDLLRLHPSTIYKLTKKGRFRASESAATGDSKGT